MTTPTAPSLTDPVLAAATVTKLHVIAAIDEAVMELLRIRAEYITDLSGPSPFGRLLAADEMLRSRPNFNPLASGEYSAAMRRIKPPKKARP